jgi:hypothetical protein
MRLEHGGLVIEIFACGKNGNDWDGFLARVQLSSALAFRCAITPQFLCR